jgi:hypothetical protein
MNKEFTQHKESLASLNVGLRSLIENWLLSKNFLSGYKIDKNFYISFEKNHWISEEEFANFPDYIKFNNIIRDDRHLSPILGQNIGSKTYKIIGYEHKAH